MIHDLIAEAAEPILADLKKTLLAHLANDLADWLITPDWEEVRAWMLSLDRTKRRIALIQLLAILQHAEEEGFIHVIFEQTDWHLTEADQEETGFTPAHSTELAEVNVAGTVYLAGANDDILVMRPKLKPGLGRRVSVMLTPD